MWELSPTFYFFQNKGLGKEILKFESASMPAWVFFHSPEFMNVINLNYTQVDMFRFEYEIAFQERVHMNQQERDTGDLSKNVFHMYLDELKTDTNIGK